MVPSSAVRSWTEMHDVLFGWMVGVVWFVTDTWTNGFRLWETIEFKCENFKGVAPHVQDSCFHFKSIPTIELVFWYVLLVDPILKIFVHFYVTWKNVFNIIISETKINSPRNWPLTASGDTKSKWSDKMRSYLPQNDGWLPIKLSR